MKTSTSQSTRPLSRSGWIAAAVPLRPITILLVDDDPSIHRFIGGALGDRKFRLVSTESVAAAVESLRTDTPDLVMIDLNLGDVPGWNLLEILRSDSAYRRVPVVILTSSEQMRDRRRSLTMGADRYLTKPVSADQVRKAIRELMSTRDDLWFAMSLASGESHHLRELLYDPTARAQTLASAIEVLRPQVERGRTIGVWWIAFDPLFEVSGSLWDKLDEFRRKMVRGIEIVISPIIGGDVTVSVTHPGANEFQCFADYEDSLASSSTRRTTVEKSVRSLAIDTKKEIGLDEEIAVFVTCARTSHQALYAPRLLYEAVRTARESAERRRNLHLRQLTRTLMRAIAEHSITTMFQPVVEMESGHVYGFEAFSKGPEGAEIERPGVLFELAHQADLMWELELLCIENVVPYLDEICSRGKLFFSLDATFVHQLHNRGLSPLEPLLRCKDNVVVVIAESAMRDFSIFRDTLRDLKRMGFSIALAGGGSASLETLAHIAPDYLKVGPALLQQAGNEGATHRLLRSIARMATEVGAKTIAEPIETEEQRQICLGVDIPLGQGYLFARPRPWAELSALGSAPNAA
jgi:EAL domain-containing protein (putative c-di-GMP-specific phosphodiesterase class I)/DNA-binding response OmpR family regulator